MKRPPFFYGWVIVGVSALLGFLGTGFYSYSRGVFLPSLAEDLAGGSRFAIAMGFSVAGVTGALISPYLGQLLDRFSPKRGIVPGAEHRTMTASHASPMAHRDEVRVSSETSAYRKVRINRASQIRRAGS